MDEEGITDLVASFIRRCGWTVHSTHYPGAQGGLRIPEGGGGAAIPDIVASHPCGDLLAVETKPSYHAQDCVKVLAVTRGEDFADGRSHVCELLNRRGRWWPAHAFQGAVLAPLHPGVAFFRVTDGEVQVVNAPQQLHELLR